MSVKRAEVAKEAGVSESTVSRSLANSPRISQPTRERVQQVAKEMGYVPDRQAALLSSKNTFRLGLVIRSYASFPPFSRAFFPAVLDGAVMAAEERNYNISVILDRRENEIKDFSTLVRSREVDGLLFSVTSLDDARFDQLVDQQVPFVLLNSYRTGCNSSDARPGHGMAQALDYAVTINQRRITFITGDMNFQNARDRLACFEQLAQDRDLQTRIVKGTFSRTNGYRITGELMQSEQRPNLIMTSSDRAAIGVLDYCRDHAIRVPEDLKVIGYDDLAPAGEVTPALTTVANPVREVASRGTHLLIDILEKEVTGPVQKWMDTHFVVRKSTCMNGGSNA